jgi:hypothetical protein
MLWGDRFMPAKNGKQPTTKSVPSKPSDISWVNYTLSTEQKAELKSQDFDFDAAAIRLTEENLKITISYDDFNECYSAFLIPKSAEHKNAGCILSGRGSTPIKAVKQAAYIHWNIFDGDWSDARRPSRDEIDD